MKIKQVTSLLVLASVMSILFSCGVDVEKVKVEDENDKTLYAMGVMLGSNLQRLELNDKELNALFKGLKHASTGKQPEVEMAMYQPKIQDLFRDRMQKVVEVEKKKGDEFMAKFLKEEGAKKTASGLAYKPIKEGTGKAPKEEETVEVHYHGTLTDGTVFDSSVERNKTISFPLNRVIKGWTEGLQLMKEGGKYRFVIPADLAYGEAGAPPKIPGGATLVFDVELFKVTKGEAAPTAPAVKAKKK
ncbi:MAG: FKBP-type peptidyl-prolyl cis-trans isomerase [Bacteriovoracaceae bacterium]|nr:FKBP-type peptidyl-prolyl cis-trans isomerase [Bacteriovoracaceae bacterium]